MPDSPPTPEAESPQPQPEVDELAKGLPGLPIASGHARVDECGVWWHGHCRRWRDIEALSYATGTK
ncbi:MAG: hypothetical protein ACYTKD_24730, partial [Planctomycetota bacterium]